MMEQERAVAVSERQAKLSSLRDEINESVAKQKEVIHQQVEEARATLGEDARRIATEIGSQILHRPLSDAVTKSPGLNA
jgi:F0F1-type ATP synthase membrane subunit b/b'